MFDEYLLVHSYTLRSVTKHFKFSSMPLLSTGCLPNWYRQKSQVRAMFGEMFLAITQSLFRESYRIRCNRGDARLNYLFPATNKDLLCVSTI